MPTPSPTAPPDVSSPLSSCSGLVDPGCVHDAGARTGAFDPPALPDIIGHYASSAFDDLAKAVQSAVAWVIRTTSAGWLKDRSVNLEAEPAVHFIQGITQPVTIAVAVAALLIVAGRLALTRRANPLIDTGTGLALLVATTVIGVTLPNKLLEWGDDWSDWVLGPSSEVFAARLQGMIGMAVNPVPSVVVFFLGLIALFICMIQAILLIFRHGALLILAGVLPLAAAGTLAPATKAWFKKVSGWMLALIFYKPCAAMVYASAFTLVGQGKDPRTVLVGIAMMVVSLVAFPVLLKFFTWTTGSGDGQSGSGAFLGAVIGGVTAVGALRSFGGGDSPSSGSQSAGQHADFMNQQLGDPATHQTGQQQPPVKLPTPAPDRNNTGSGSLDGQLGDPATPTGSGPDSSITPPSTGQGAPSGSAAEPIGPATIQTFHGFKNYAPDLARWLHNPDGSGQSGGLGGLGDSGGPSGAAGGGGGGGA